MSDLPGAEPRQDGGYVLVYRRVFEDPDFRDELEASIFVYLIAKAVWRDTTTRYKTIPVSLTRGQFAVSTRDLAARFRVSQSTIARFMGRLESGGKLVQGVVQGVPVLTLCKYDAYQRSSEEGDAPSASDVVQPWVSGGSHKNKGKESKEGKKEGFRELTLSAAAAPQPIDPWKVVFDTGVQLLVGAGKSEPQARAVIGKWRKDHPAGDLITAIAEAQRLGVTDPVSWVTAALGAKRSGQSHYGAPELKPVDMSATFAKFNTKKASGEAARG